MIKASHFVSVSIAKSGLFPAKAGFGELCVVTNDTTKIRRSERIRHYTDIDGVVADWGVTSEAAKAATSYYSQSPRPKKLAVAVRYEIPQAAELVGGASSSVSDFTSITGGSMVLEIDGFSAPVAGLNFTTATTMDDVATIIQTATRAAMTGVANNTLITVIHDGTRFIMESPNPGATSSIGFATPNTSGTDVSSLVKWRQGEAASVDGIDGEEISESLTAINDVDASWYGLLFTKEVRDGVLINGTPAVMGAAAWCEARTKRFFNTTNNIDALNAASAGNIGLSIKAAGYGRTMTTFSTYPDAYPSASMAGIAFTVNFEQANSTMTLNLKEAPGIVGEDLTSGQLAALQAGNMNAIVSIGSQKRFTDSRMGDGRFFDEGHGLDWLIDSMQVAVYGHLSTTTTKVPYTDGGAASIEQQMDGVLAQAVRNGLGAPGVTADGEFLSRGYKITVPPVSDVAQSLVDARVYSGITFTLIGAGAMHSVEINGQFE